MRFYEEDLVKRKNNDGKIFKVTRVYEDRDGDEVIDIENIKDEYDEVTCYPEQLERI